MASRRPHGTGSVYQRASDGLWVGTIEAGYTAKGTRRRVTISAKSKPEAQRKLRDKMREVALSGTPTAGVSAKVTVRTWCETWLANTQTTAAPRTWANNRSNIRQWVVPTIGHRRLDQLTPGDIRSVADSIHRAGRSGSTATRVHAVLMKALRDALIEGHMIPARVLTVSGPSAGESDRDVIPMADTLDILRVAAGHPNGSRWAAAFLQGMRPGECLGLTWGCVDMDAGTLDVSWQLDTLPYNEPHDVTSGFRVPRGYTARRLEASWHLVRPKTKSGKRIIPLTPWMAAALTRWREIAPPSKHDLVWPRTGGRPQVDSDDSAAWYALQDAAQVARVDDGVGRRYTLYEARHTCATMLRELGADDETIVAILGHASILSSKAYLHTTTERTRQAMSELADRLGLTVGGGAAPALESVPSAG